MPRKKYYKPAIITLREFQQFQSLVSSIERQRKQQISVFSDYKSFCTKNGLEPQLATSAGRFCGALEVAGYDPGTIGTRLDYILGEMARERGGGLTWKILAGHYASKKALKGRKAKVDRPHLVLIAQICEAPKHLARTLLAFVVLTGSRNGCIGGLGDIRMSDALVSADVKVSKQRRCPNDFATLVLRGEFNLFSLFSAEVRCDLLQWARDRSIIGQRRQMATSSLQHWANRHIDSTYTTFTFRRAYIHHVLALCEENGLPNYERARRYTLHFKDSTIRAFYEKRCDDLEE